MPKISKVVKDDLENEDDSLSDSSIEMLTTKNKKTEKPSSKQVKEKKPYVLTDARKAQFEKARLIQKEKALQKKKENDELKQIEKEKQELLKLKQEKEKKAKIKEIKKIKKEIEVESSDSEEEELEPVNNAISSHKQIKRLERANSHYTYKQFANNFNRHSQQLYQHLPPSYNSFMNSNNSFNPSASYDRFIQLQQKQHKLG